MTIELPLWLQGDGAGSAVYPARLDRQLISNLFTEGILGPTSFAVSERGAGANFTVDVAAGVAVIEGDDEANQGNYLAVSTSTENIVVSAAPGSNSRYDLVVLQVNDPQAGGGAGDNITIEVVAGTAAASPTIPTTPDSALLLATLLVTSSHVAIETADITDARVISRLAHEVVDSAQIASNAITGGKIPADAVGTSEIEADAVTTVKIKDANVTEAKLAAAVLSSSWTNVTGFESGWTTPTDATQRLKYKKVGNLVYIQGGVKFTGTTTGAAVTIANNAISALERTSPVIGYPDAVLLTATTTGGLILTGPTNGYTYFFSAVFQAAT